MIDKKVEVIIDRPIGSTHPKYKNILYEVNYGYIENIMAGDGEEQDAYILGIDYPVDRFIGNIIAIIHRKNDNEDKWVVSNNNYSKEEILKVVNFQEQYFDIEIKII